MSLLPPAPLLKSKILYWNLSITVLTLDEFLRINYYLKLGTLTFRYFKDRRINQNLIITVTKGYYSNTLLVLLHNSRSSKYPLHIKSFKHISQFFYLHVSFLCYITEILNFKLKPRLITLIVSRNSDTDLCVFYHLYLRFCFPTVLFTLVTEIESY